MQARIRLNALATSTGDRQGWTDVEARTLRGFHVEQRMSENEWTHGILASGVSRLAVWNADGRFSASHDGRSMFALAGADYAQVQVDYPTANGAAPTTPIWRGFVSSKGSKVDHNAKTASWTCRPPDAAIREARLNAGLVAQGQTLRQAVAAVFTQAQIGAAMPTLDLTGFYDPSSVGGGATTIESEADLIGDDFSALGVLQRILAAIDGVLAYNPNTETAYIQRRGAQPVISTTPLTQPDHLEILDVHDGTEMIYNQIVAETGAGDDYTTRNEGSIARWGLNSLEIDLKWTRSLAVSQVLADNLLERLATPHRAVKLALDGWALDPATAFVGAGVSVDIPPLAPVSAPKLGTMILGVDSPTRCVHDGLFGRFYIEEIKRDLGNDTMQVRLRELN